MEYPQLIRNISVLGAAGKMGSGIVWLSLKEMAGTWIEHGRTAPMPSLVAMDTSAEALEGLKKYIQAQAARMAEKQPAMVQKWFPGTPEKELAQGVISLFLEILHTTTRLDDTFHTPLVFEAVSENRDLKVRLFREINQNSNLQPWFLSNTSSVPIAEMDREAGLNGRIVGFHFYNPPAVQKLVELIVPATTLPELADFAGEYARRLGKTIVYSSDFAGFIGNGHFMRDLLFGIGMTERLQESLSFPEAVYTVNRISSEYLVRPMGIFQLSDYVGLDVCRSILKVMNPYFPDEKLHSPLLDDLVDRGIRGGQYADGSQKNGFLRYEEGKITGVLEYESLEYRNLKELELSAGPVMGTLPGNIRPWKETIRLPDRAGQLAEHFALLRKSSETGARLAIEYLEASRNIAALLVNQGIAGTEQDVNTVLETGFYHAYGPFNHF